MCPIPVGLQELADVYRNIRKCQGMDDPLVQALFGLIVAIDRVAKHQHDHLAQIYDPILWDADLGINGLFFA